MKRIGWLLILLPMIGHVVLIKYVALNMGVLPAILFTIAGAVMASIGVYILTLRR